MRDERERRLLPLQYRIAPSLLPALVGLFLFYVALMLGAAVAVAVHALFHFP